MLSRGRLVFIFVSLSVVLVLVGGSLMAATANEDEKGDDSLYKYLSMFVDVLDLIKRAYVEETEPGDLLSGALDGAADALDPFSMYIPAAAVDRYVESRAVGAARSGLVVLKERGVAYAVAVHEGSPAAEAGLERGDLLAQLQGRRTRTMPLWEIHGILAGPVGTKIEIQRVRVGQQESVSFVLGPYRPPGVVLETHRGVAVLRIEAIGADTANNVETSLAALAGDGDGDGEGAAALPDLERADRLVIDLRNLAGGDAEVAYRVAGLFVQGELGALTDREKALREFSSDEAPRFSGPLAVMINRGTQGAAEILATVLQQRAGAALVGEPSFGHSGRQSLIELSNGDRLQLTTAFFTGPDRAPLNDGLDPDLRVRPMGFDLEDEEGDPVLDRALEVVLGETELEKAA